jgi:hypothetical protein
VQEKVDPEDACALSNPASRMKVPSGPSRRDEHDIGVARPVRKLRRAGDGKRRGPADDRLTEFHLGDGDFTDIGC